MGAHFGSKPRHFTDGGDCQSRQAYNSQTQQQQEMLQLFVTSLVYTSQHQKQFSPTKINDVSLEMFLLMSKKPHESVKLKENKILAHVESQNVSRNLHSADMSLPR